jgi:hypothetical protein
MSKKSTGSKGTVGKEKATTAAPKLASAGNTDAGSEALKKGTAPADAAGKPEGAASAAGAATDTGAGKKGTTQSIPGLEVTSTRDGFRRAGLVWSKEPTTVAVDSLSEAQIGMLLKEPALSVREVEMPVESKGE